jgi:hypothetical protein
VIEKQDDAKLEQEVTTKSLSQMNKNKIIVVELLVLMV